MLQCKLFRKALEVCAALSAEDRLDYEVVKAAILRAYELVPKAYRQKFRDYRKGKLLVKKSVLFDKWIAACKNQ